MASGGRRVDGGGLAMRRMRRTAVVVALAAVLFVATFGNVVVADTRLPASIASDVQATLGAEAHDSAFPSAESDSITVVPHTYFAQANPVGEESSERSLLHAAETITHHVESEMEDATYADIPNYTSALSYDAPADDGLAQATYTTDIDPAFMIETQAHEQPTPATAAAQGVAHELYQEAALDHAERTARERAEEFAIGLIEQQAEIMRTNGGSSAASVTSAATSTDKFYTPEYAKPPIVTPKPAADAPAPQPAAPSKQYVQPEYAATVKPLKKRAPKPENKYVQPEMRRAPKPRSQAQSQAQPEVVTSLPQGWSVAPTLKPSEKKSTDEKEPSSKKERATQTIKKVAEHEVEYRAKRLPSPSVDPKAATKSTEARQRRPAAKASRRYIQPTFYPVQKPQPPKPKPQPRPQPPKPQMDEPWLYEPVYYPPPRPQPQPLPNDPRILVNTPHGPVYVLYVAKPKPTKRSVQQVAFNMHPRALTHATRKNYELPQAPRSPYAPRQGQRAAYKTLAQRRRAEAAAEAARQQQLAERNTQYDPRTGTLIRHVHHHRYTRLPKPVPQPDRVVQVITPGMTEAEVRAATLRRAFVKLCKLQRAILRKYQREQQGEESEQARRTRRAHRAAARRRTFNTAALFPHPHHARLVSRADRLNKKYSPETRAAALTDKYTAAQHERVHRRAQQLIAEAEIWLSERDAQRAARREHLRNQRIRHAAAKRECRRRAHELGLPVPPQCQRLSPEQRGARRHAWQTHRAAMREARAARRRARHQAMKVCRVRAHLAGRPVPAQCQQTPREVRRARYIVMQTRREQRREAWRARCAAKRSCRRQARRFGIPIPPECALPSPERQAALEAYRAERRARQASRHAQREARRIARKLREAARANEAVRARCRLEAHAMGLPVPPQCRSSDGRDGKVPVDVVDRVHLNRIRRAKRHCRDVARSEGLPIPAKCMPEKAMNEAVFKKNRYDPKTNTVRFAQVEVETEAEAETETKSVATAETGVEAEAEAETEAAESEADPEPLTAAQLAAQEAAELKEAETATTAAFEPIEGLDYNQSSLTKKLLSKLRQKKQ